MNKRNRLIKQIFDTVYQWGKIGMEVDEKCNTYQSYMKDLEAFERPEEEFERIEEQEPQEEIEDIEEKIIRLTIKRFYLEKKLNEEIRKLIK